MANRYAFEVAQGEDRQLSMTARTRLMEAVDLTGGSVTVRVARRPGLSALATSAATIVSATDGTFTVDLTAEQTTNFPRGDLFFSALFTASDGKVSRVAEGTIRCKRRIEA